MYRVTLSATPYSDGHHSSLRWGRKTGLAIQQQTSPEPDDSKLRVPERPYKRAHILIL